MSETPSHPTEFTWGRRLREEAIGSATRGRWGPALMLVGWVHLTSFVICQWLVTPGIRSDPRHLGMWVVDVAVSLLVIRKIAGPGWFRDTPAALLIAKIWGTFLILAFSLATLNTLSGWERDWFKPPWATLSSFGFATMTWLFGVRFLFFAFQMYLTGLLMISLPRWHFLIYGVSWWLALQILGASLWIRCRKGAI